MGNKPCIIYAKPSSRTRCSHHWICHLNQYIVSSSMSEEEKDYGGRDQGGDSRQAQSLAAATIMSLSFSFAEEKEVVMVAVAAFFLICCCL